MEELYEKYFRKLDNVPLDFIRGISDTVDWNARLIGFRGARGIGKTTLLLQYIKNRLPRDESSLYVSLDSIWFSENRLVGLADRFVKQGGHHLFLDEVHKYPDWSKELKNIYDDYPDLRVVFTGSSLLEILNARADLSRRAVIYTMQGLSFREYLSLNLSLELPVFSLDDVLQNQIEAERMIISSLKPLKHFSSYLKTGYYPFYHESPGLYFSRIEEILNMIMEIELPLLRKVDISSIAKLKRLIQIIAESVPFIPNISKLSERTGLNRNTIILYLGYLQEAHIIMNLYKDARGITRLQKPDKVYLENTNLLYALTPSVVNTGNLWETFFINQLGYGHRVEYAEHGDFIVDGRYVFETGGKSKSNKQIKGQKESYIVSDDIEYGAGNKIPLWLFGFLY